MNKENRKNAGYSSEELDAFVDGINATGYPFEFRTVQLLQSKGWHVISNKYYIDVEDEKPREIDLLAYKVTTTDELLVSTAIIVSCKKSETETWAFLTRGVDSKKLNTNSYPLHYWTDSIGLQYEIDDESFAKRYYQSGSALTTLQEPDFEVFALQEMELHQKGKGDQAHLEASKKGDSRIYSSIMTLMKAQAYEKNSRPDRVYRQRKLTSKKRIYQFNLVSACDLDFVRLHFSDEPISASNENSVPYIGRYILENQEIFARIEFVSEPQLGRLVDTFNAQHEHNVVVFSAAENEFRTNALKDQDRLLLAMKPFFEYLIPRIAEDWPMINIDPSIHYLSYDPESDLASIWIYGIDDEALLEALNSDEAISVLTKRALKSHFYHHGEFVFIDPPF